MKRIFLLALLTAQFLHAFAFRSEYGKNIIVSRPVYEDLYIAGGNITINAPIYGDLIIAGGTITINDTVENDILLAGGRVLFNGYVGDDIRCTGGSMRISKNVAGDVVAAGGEIIVDADVVIGGLVISGSDVTLNGDVSGELRGVFGRLNLNGNIAKGIDCRGGTVAINGTVGGKSIVSSSYIILGDKAVFNNDVRYWSEQSALDFSNHMKNGKAIYDHDLRINTDKWYLLGSSSFFLLLWYLSMALLMILTIQYLFAGIFRNSAITVLNQSLKSFAFGILFFIGTPVAAIVAFSSIVGVPLGIILLFAYVILILLATVIASIVTANWLNNQYEKQWSFWQLTFVAFGIFVLLKLIFLTPFVGWLILGLMITMSFGAILLSIPWKKQAYSK